MIDVEKFLQTNGIAFVHHEHPAVFTCEEAEVHCAQVPGMPGKNLFLKNKKDTRYFLVVLPATKRADLKKFAGMVGESSVRFACAEELSEKLGLEVGSVSPFGLLNDSKKEVEVYIDRDIYDTPLLNFHPNRNTASLEITNDMFRKYLDLLAMTVNIIDDQP